MLLLFSDKTAWLGRASAFSVLVDIRAGGEDLVLGQVEWVVIASSEHNASIPSVLKRYPAAKVIGSKVSEEKLNCINALPRKEFDYKCSDKKSLESANHLLRGNGVELFYISGDIATHSVFCVAHGVGLECDLVYGRAGQYGEVPEDWTGCRVLDSK